MRAADGRRRAGRPGRQLEGPQLAGWLRRKSGPASGWQRGWCVLTGSQLAVFADKGGTRQLTLDLRGCTCRRSQAPPAPTGSGAPELELVTRERTHRLDAETAEHAERWLAALCAAVGSGPPGAAAGARRPGPAGSSAATAPTASSREPQVAQDARAWERGGGGGGAGSSAPVAPTAEDPQDAQSPEQVLERARQLVQRSQLQAAAAEAETQDVWVVVADEVALRDRPSHRGSSVVGKAVRGDRLQVGASREAWVWLENGSWAPIANGTRTYLVRAGEELREFMRGQPDALRPRAATNLSFEPRRCEGWMLKRGEVRHSWKCRYFVLSVTPAGSKLRYYEEGGVGQTPRKMLGTVSSSDCHAVRGLADGGLELTVVAGTVHNQPQARVRRKAGDGGGEEQGTRCMELLPVPSKVAHVPAGRPSLDGVPVDERQELAERWLQALEACF